MERIEQLKIGALRLIQDDTHLKIGVDSITLAAFARVKKGGRVLDLGCGSGVLSLLLAARNRTLSIDALDVDRGAYELAKRNVSLNGFEENIRVFERDLRELPDFMRNYTAVISNPPYYKPDKGFLPESESMRRALFEMDCTIDEVCRAASSHMQTGGRFFISYRPERLSDLICALKNHTLEPKRMLFVQHTVRHAPDLVLIEAQKGAAVGLNMMKPLILKTLRGNETAEYIRMYTGGVI